MDTSNLESIIEDSLTDAISEPVEPAEVDTDTPVTDTPEVAPETPVEAPEANTETPVEPMSQEVASPASKTPVKEDEFAKKYGLPQQIPGQRENRIPQPRVKIMVEKAAAEAKDAAIKEYEPKILDYETKLKEKDGLITQFGQFEHIMVNDADKFLGMLANLPIYQPFFQKVNELYQAAQGVSQPEAQPTAQTSVTDNDPMPGPDQDGFYTEEGLQKRLDWEGRRVEQRVAQRVDQQVEQRLKQVEQRYAPIEDQWKRQAQEKAQQDYLNTTVIPSIEREINEARTWPKFIDNEEAITKELQQNPKLSLEGAYRKIVIPKIMADRDTMRQSILADIGKAPVSPSVPMRPSRPNPQPSNQPRSIISVIEEAVQSIK